MTAETETQKLMRYACDQEQVKLALRYASCRDAPISDSMCMYVLAAEVHRLRQALERCAAVTPTYGKRSRNAGALYQIQALAKAALDGAQ